MADPSAAKKALSEKGCLMVAHSIIGRVRLVDVVRGSSSPWAQEGCYHWMLSDAELWENPLPQVTGHLRLWTFDLPESYTASSLV
jgi:hypothetical protein